MAIRLKQAVEFVRLSWQRTFIAAICVVIVIARMIFPSLNVDWISVVLLAIAMTAFLLPRLNYMLPHLVKALPYIRKAKLAGVELEFSDKIRDLARNLDHAEDQIATEGNVKVGDQYPQGQEEVLVEVRKDPRAALLLLAAKIEQQVMRRLIKSGVHPEGRFLPVQQAIDLGIHNGVFPKAIQEPFRAFWNLRNEVAHGMAFDVDTSLVLSLISVGLEVLKLVSVEEGNGSKPTE